MRTVILFIGLVISQAYASFAQTLSVDQVIAKYYDAIGIKNLLKMKTIVMKGVKEQQDIMPYKLSRMRDYKYLLEFDVADLAAIQAYDGTTGWMTSPWTGNMKPQEMKGDQLKDIKARADFDGSLYKWKEKGHKAELAGEEKLQNNDVYKIKLTRNDDIVEYYLIDKKSFLLLKKISVKITNGKEVNLENVFTDYKNVNGVFFPFIIESYIGDQPYNTIHFEKIETDVKVAPEKFVMPK